MSRLSTSDQVYRQVRYQNTIFWRTPIAAFFTIVFPLMFLIVFTLVFGNDELGGLGVTTVQFYAPALAVFGAVSATYTNLSVSTAIARDEGILKRVRGTPLPPWVYIAGRIGSAAYLAVISAGLMLAVGVIVYGLQVFNESIPALTVTFLVGIACFAALGLLLAALVPSGESAPAVANATLLPLAFISDIFIPIGEDAPAWLDTVASIFPLKHFAVAFQDGFNPVFVAQQQSWIDHFNWASLAVMTAWGVGGAVLAIRFFKWEPQAKSGTSRRGRRTKRHEDPAVV